MSNSIIKEHNIIRRTYDKLISELKDSFNLKETSNYALYRIVYFAYLVKNFGYFLSEDGLEFNVTGVEYEPGSYFGDVPEYLFDERILNFLKARLNPEYGFTQIIFIKLKSKQFYCPFSGQNLIESFHSKCWPETCIFSTSSNNLESYKYINPKYYTIFQTYLNHLKNNNLLIEKNSLCSWIDGAFAKNEILLFQVFTINDVIFLVLKDYK